MTAQNNTANDSQSPPEECLSLARFLAAEKKHMMRRPHLCSRVKPVHLDDNFSIDIKVESFCDHDPINEKIGPRS